MSATEIAGIAVAVAAFLAVVVNLANVLLTQANERRRSQPIVVTHEEQSRMFAGEGIWNVKVRVTNEGPTPAFNVRYGVSYFGARFAFRLFEEDPLGGNRHKGGLRIPASRCGPSSQFRASISLAVQARRSGHPRRTPSIGRGSRTPEGRRGRRSTLPIDRQD